MESHDLRPLFSWRIIHDQRMEITMSEIKITAEPRTDFGKGYARRIRACWRYPRRYLR